MIAKSLVEELANERIQELDKGIFIVDISISSSNEIDVEIDKVEGYVSIEECISVSRNIEHNLDREEQDFELSVSSAGLDKPLRVLPQFHKNYGREVEVLLKDGQKHIGTLKEATEEALVLTQTRVEKPEGKKKKETIVEDVTFLTKDIKETKIVISFK